MKSAKKAFTLIEMMVSITILSIMILFLYKTYASFNLSNATLKKELDITMSMQKIRKTIYLDFTLAFSQSLKIQNREKNEDVVFLQTSNSIHRRYNPYVVYKVKDKKLYRLESLKQITTYELPIESEFDIDYLGEVESFRVYKSSDKKHNTYLLEVGFKGGDDVLFKVKALN